MFQTPIPKTFYLLVVLTIIAYIPGLSGPFLYDDFANLQILSSSFSSNISNIRDILSSGISSEIGRPIAIISFMLQPQSFPDSALTYKAINLLIHLINGYLVFILSSLLYQNLNQSSKNEQLFALLSTALWLLHPLFVSTTLYVIQRMTQLSFLFSVITLIYFFSIRIDTLNKLSSLLKPFSILTLLITLAVLSKENAVMIFPILLLLGIHLNKQHNNTLYRNALMLFCVIPVILLSWKLLPYASTDRFASAGYDYTAIERVMTQIVVLKSYISQLLLPNVATMTLHHDDFKLVTSLTDSRFLISIIICFVLIIIAIFSNNKLLRFAIIWFFVWHLIESTFIPLILYFEHRNYLPGLGIIWVLSLAILSLRKRVSHEMMKNAVAVIPIILFMSSTLILSILWSDQNKLIAHWTSNHPESERSTLAKFNNTITIGNLIQAEHDLTIIPEYLRENSLAISLTHMSIHCALGTNDREITERAISQSTQPSKMGRIIPDVHSSVTTTLIRNKNICPDALADLQTVSENILEYAPQKQRRAFIAQISANQAFLALNQNAPEASLEYFIRAHDNGRHELIIPMIDLSMKLEKFNDVRNYISIAEKYEQTRDKKQPSIANQLGILIKRFDSISTISHEAQQEE